MRRGRGGARGGDAALLHASVVVSFSLDPSGGSLLPSPAMAAPPAPHEGDDGNNGVEVCLFDESPEDFSSAVRAISELAAGEPEPSFPDAEVERLASSITFLREWRFFSYEPKGVSFTHSARSTSSRDDTHEITLPQFSSASVPQVAHLEDGRDNNTDSSDFILFAGGNVWSLDWCPRLCDKPCSSVNCEYLAVAAHPPGSSYHKIGMPLIGRGIIQVWCLVAPFEEAHTDQSMAVYTKSNRRGRPRKIPDVSNSIDSSVPRKPIGRPRKIKLTTTDDHAEPSLKKPRGRPRKYPLSVAKVLDSTDNSASQDHSFIDPLVPSGVIAGDLALSCAIPTVKPAESTPKKGRGRPRKIPKCLPAIELKDMSRALVCIKPKKKMGRPRKYPPPISSKHALGTIPEFGSETACLAVSTCNSGHNGGEQNSLTTPKPSDNVASVDNCKKQIIVYTRRRVRQPTKKCDSSETSSLAFSGDIQKMERSSTSIMPNNHLSAVEKPKLLGSSISKDMANAAGLAGCKSAVVNCELMEMNESEAPNQIVPVPFENSAQIIDELEDTEVAPFKESSNNSNIITCAENLRFSAIPKGIHLPRVVLCLAHNGKVAWDIKWKPPSPDQSEQKSRLGFLAILLGNGSLEVWEVPSPSMIQKIYSSSSMDGTDPRFLKLRPVFRCAKVKCGNRQSIPLIVDWSPSPHDMILAGCHDGTVALWKFSTDLSSQDSKPFMCVTAESVPIRALSWAPYVSEENTNTFVTAGEDGLKFWDLRDLYRPLWELSTAPRAVLSLHWLKDARGIVISLEDGTLKFLSLSIIANDVPVTRRPFAGTKTQGVSTYQLSEHLIWNVHVSETTGYAAYCGADGTAVRFQLTSRFWEKEPGRNRVPYFLCGSLAEEGTVIKIGGALQHSPLPNVPLVAKKGPKAQDIQKEKLQTITNSEYVDPELREGQLDGPDEGQESKALVLVDPQIQESGGICNGTVDECPQNVEVFPPKSIALHRLRWNMNKGSEKWLCYGGASGIIRCQRI
ncbi:hypothetical protein ACQ4PT_029908 [Festuca glaucescens]